MELTYQICAWVGGTLIVCQFLLTLFGMGGDSDGDAGGAEVDFDAGGHDVVGQDAAAAGPHQMEAAGHGTNWIFGILTFRTIVAGLAFFGLTGLAMKDSGVSDSVRLVCSVAAGGAAIVIVAWVMRSLTRLNIDGTIRIQKAVGKTGTVYLSIPGSKSGTGKIHISVQGRLMEYKAVTSFPDLPTGSRVVVTKVIGSDTVEVQPAGTLETSAHT